MKLERRLAYLGIAFIVFLASNIQAPAAALTKEEWLKQNNEVSQKLSSLNAQLKDIEAQANALSTQASTLESQIALLQAEQASIQAQIDLKEAEHDAIVLEIENIQNRIDQNSDIISVIIAQYYYNSGVSTIERIASSESFASYLDNEMRLNGMADTVVSIIEENERLKQQAIVKKAEAEQILADLDTQKAALESKKQQQAILLAETRSSEAKYQEMRAATKSQRDALQAEQDRLNAQYSELFGASGIRPGNPNKGGYPYSEQCPAAKINGRQYADRWGMYICECVSYAAWRVYHAYGNMPYWGGMGNANQWVNNARRLGIPYGSTPKPGSVGISLSGPWGHAVWVEYVRGSRVGISQYNYRINGVPGQYSEMEVNAGAYTYIYFGEWNR